MRVLGKNRTLSINGVAIPGGFRAEKIVSATGFEVKFGLQERGIQQLETLPRRERNWLAGYLEIKNTMASFRPTRRQWKKLNDPRRSGGYPVSMWRRLEHASVTFFGGRCAGKVRHIKRLAESMVWVLADLSGDSFWDITENMNSYQIAYHCTPSGWNTIWTGE